MKREWYDGRLATREQRRLPILAAAAGMAVPALLYLLIVRFDANLVRGWAIPSATDIAFAVGVLALLGSRASASLKLLLVTIAIVDDVGAVIIIALVYTSSLSATAIGASLLIVGIMAALNLFGVRSLWPYLIGFIALWLAMLASGIHPTISGVLAAFTVPLGLGEAQSSLKRLEHAIHPWVMLGIMPLFGLVSAGVHLSSFDELAQPLTIAVALGLFAGKQLGVFGSMWLAVRGHLCLRPAGTSWTQLYGASLLCGIGFTMSLFIGGLAFPDAPGSVEAAKLGTLAGSLLSAIAGFAVLRFCPGVPAVPEDREQAAEIFAGDEEE